MKTPLIYLSLLSVSSAFCTLTYTPNSHAKNIQPTTHIGTWQNKDEDGDGVPDVQDDYPFEASKTQYPVYFEKEPNDNPSVATPVELGKGFKVKGVISSRTDKGDLYGFNVDDRTMVTAVFESAAKRFDPQVYVSNSEGRVISKYVISEYKKFGKHIVNFHMFDAGRYQLSVMDNNYAGGPDLTYSMVLFYDEDVDAFDDEKERAFGSNLIKNDQDQDGILDGLEHVLLNSSTDIDFDGDGIPNWKDIDSDDDSFTDKIEGIEDLDKDGFPNYIDRDADGNSIDDEKEIGDFNYSLDFDDDGKLDHLDLDDDDDLILDIYDTQRRKKSQTVKLTGPNQNRLLVRWVYNMSLEGHSIRDFIRAGDKVEFEVDGLPAGAKNLVLVFQYPDELINLKPTIAKIEASKTYISVEVPSKVGEAYVYLAHDEVISDAQPIEVNKSKSPLLKPEKRSISAGETITLVGENFNEQTVVHFKNVTVNSIYIDEKTIKIKTPRQLSGWRYWVSNQFGKSNAVSFSIE